MYFEICHGLQLSLSRNTPKVEGLHISSLSSQLPERQSSAHTDKIVVSQLSLEDDWNLASKLWLDVNWGNIYILLIFQSVSSVISMPPDYEAG